MAFKANINEASRILYYSAAGNDDSDGRSLELPKLSPQSAIDAAAALLPPPALATPVRVKEAQGGVFIGDVILKDFVLFEGLQTALVGIGSIGVTAADSISLNVQGLVNTGANSVGLLIDGNTSFGAFAQAMQSRGANSQIVKVTGSVDDIFIEAKQVLADADGICCFHVDATSPVPIDINCDTVTLNSTNGTFLEWNQPNSLDVGAVQVTSVAGIGSGSIAIHLLSTNVGNVSCYCHVMQGDILCEGGGLALDALVIDGDITIEDGAEATIKSTGVLRGDITVDSGGILFIVVNNHDSGTVTNNGTINGIIDGVRYGNWIVAVEELITPETDVRQVLSPDGSGMTEWVLRFGSDYQFENDESESATTSTTFQNKLTLTTPSIPAGNYKITAHAEITNDSGDKPVVVQIVLDGSLTNDFFYAPKFEDEYLPFQSFASTALIAGVHDIDIDFAATSEGGTAKIRRARLEIFRVP